MRKITRILTGFVLAAGMFVSLGNTAMAKTYALSEILAEVHQRENHRGVYYFEGGEDIMSPAFSHTGAGPFFAPGDQIVSDIPGVYLFTSNPEMDNLKKVRSLLASGHSFTYNPMDGAVGYTIGEGAPVPASVYYPEYTLYDDTCTGYTLYDTYTENSPKGLFQSMHIVSQEDEKAVQMLSAEYAGERKVWNEVTTHTPAKSYRGFIIEPYYTADGTILVYDIKLRTYDDIEPNAEQYYTEKAVSRAAGQPQAPAETDMSGADNTSNVVAQNITVVGW